MKIKKYKVVIREKDATILDLVVYNVRRFLEVLGFMFLLLVLIALYNPSLYDRITSDMYGFAMVFSRSSGSDELKKISMSLASSCANDEVCIANQFYSWITKNIKYSQTFNCHKADYTLETLMGDCCDQAILFMSMARIAGLECRMVMSTEHRHAYSVCNLNGEKFVVDTTLHGFIPYSDIDWNESLF